MEYKEILKQFQTPFYLFDSMELNKRIEYLRRKLGSKFLLCYAVKANTFVIKELIDGIDRLEVCSPGEFEICENLNVPIEKIVVSGVNKSPEFIDRIMSNYNDLIYTAESITQFELLKSLSEKYNKKINVLLRLTSGNQFGMSKDDIENIIKEHETYKYITINGIQYFSGTQKHSIKKIEKEITLATSLIEELKQKYNFEAKELEYGAGLPVFYFETDEFDEDTFLDEFAKLLKSIDKKLKVTIELGRSIVASCGTYFTSVVDKKINEFGNFAIVDGGMNHLVYYGQTLAMKHPIHEIYPERKGTVENWNICGSLCTINDIIVKQLSIENLNIGDVLIFKNTGAYCMTEGISLFLSRDLPKVIIRNKEGKCLKVRDVVKTSSINTPHN